VRRKQNTEARSQETGDRTKDKAEYRIQNTENRIQQTAIASKKYAVRACGKITLQFPGQIRSC
jgi:hypothetical protein